MNTQTKRPAGSGWASILARLSIGLLMFEAVSGLAITCLPFHAAIQWNVIVHTIIGTASLVPLAWYLARHWQEYRSYAASHITVLGYLGLGALVLCSASGLVLTGEGLFGIRTAGVWRQVHLYSTVASFGALLPHILFSFFRARQEDRLSTAGRNFSAARWRLLLRERCWSAD